MMGAATEANIPPIVLIVEDEEPIAQALAFIVEDAGFTSQIAIHGKRALDLIRAHRPDLIITDMMMPKMSGKELIAALRAEPDLQTLPIVLMSAAGKRYMDGSGADALLGKPFEIYEIEDILQRFLGPGSAGG